MTFVCCTIEPSIMDLISIHLIMQDFWEIIGSLDLWSLFWWNSTRSSTSLILPVHWDWTLTFSRASESGTAMGPIESPWRASPPSPPWEYNWSSVPRQDTLKTQAQPTVLWSIFYFCFSFFLLFCFSFCFVSNFSYSPTVYYFTTVCGIYCHRFTERVAAAPVCLSVWLLYRRWVLF